MVAHAKGRRYVHCQSAAAGALVAGGYTDAIRRIREIHHEIKQCCASDVVQSVRITETNSADFEKQEGLRR
jgi:hypothetical protein